MSMFVLSSTAFAYTVFSFLVVIPANVSSAAMPAPVETVVEVKKVGDYRRDLKSFVKQSKSKDESIRFGAVLNLCLLHYQLVNDERYQTNRQLQGFRAVAAERLKKCKKEIELQLLRNQRTNKPSHDPRSEPDLDQPPEASGEFGFRLYEKVITDDMQAMTSITGGPVRLWQYTGNPSGPLCDHGPELVNLIENTINPDSWRRNGGNGIIEYYQPLRIIVVGASGQIHDEISDLLNTLRANGR